MTRHRELPSRRTTERQPPAGRKTAETERTAEVGAGMPDADGFAEQIIRTGAAVRLGTLLTTPPEGTLYHVPDRDGLSVVALPTTSLSREEIAGLLAYRFARVGEARHDRLVGAFEAAFTGRGRGKYVAPRRADL